MDPVILRLKRKCSSTTRFIENHWQHHLYVCTVKRYFNCLQEYL